MQELTVTKCIIEAQKNLKNTVRKNISNTAGLFIILHNFQIGSRINEFILFQFL